MPFSPKGKRKIPTGILRAGMSPSPLWMFLACAVWHLSFRPHKATADLSTVKGGGGVKAKNNWCTPFQHLLFLLRGRLQPPPWLPGPSSRHNWTTVDLQGPLILLITSTCEHQLVFFLILSRSYCRWGKRNSLMLYLCILYLLYVIVVLYVPVGGRLVWPSPWVCAPDELFGSLLWDESAV